MVRLVLLILKFVIDGRNIRLEETGSAAKPTTLLPFCRSATAENAEVLCIESDPLKLDTEASCGKIVVTYWARWPNAGSVTNCVATTNPA